MYFCAFWNTIFYGIPKSAKNYKNAMPVHCDRSSSALARDSDGRLKRYESRYFCSRCQSFLFDGKQPSLRLLLAVGITEIPSKKFRENKGEQDYFKCTTNAD